MATDELFILIINIVIHEMNETWINKFSLLVWRGHDRVDLYATDLVVPHSSPASRLCWIISPNSLYLLSWLLAHLCDK